MVTIDPRSSDRIAIVGMTGSGKTYLARWLLHTVKRLVVLDPKGTLRGQWGLREWSESARADLLEGRPVRVRVPTPIDPRERTMGDWDEYLWDVYDAGNCVLYIDETMGVVPIGTRSPVPLNAIYTRGRELGIGAISASQRPAWIPLELLSESTWFFCFRLLLEDDRKRMSGLMGPAVMAEIRDSYGFWTYQAGWSDPIYTRALEVQRVRREA